MTTPDVTFPPNTACSQYLVVPSIWFILLVLLQKQVALGNQGWYFFELIFSPWRENYFNWHLSPDWIGMISVLKFWKKHVPSVSVTQLADYIAKKDLSQKERPWLWWRGLITLSYITNWLMSNYRKLMTLTHAMDLFHKSDSQRKHSFLANHLQWWRAWPDDFMGQCAHPQACWPQCWCQGPRVGREWTPTSCPLPATCMLWHACSKSINKRERRHRVSLWLASFCFLGRGYWIVNISADKKETKYWPSTALSQPTGTPWQVKCCPSTAVTQPTMTPWRAAASALAKNTDSQFQHQHVWKIMSIFVLWIPHLQNGYIHRNGYC